MRHTLSGIWPDNKKILNLLWFNTVTCRFCSPFSFFDNSYRYKCITVKILNYPLTVLPLLLNLFFLISPHTFFCEGPARWSQLLCVNDSNSCDMSKGQHCIAGLSILQLLQSSALSSIMYLNLQGVVKMLHLSLRTQWFSASRQEMSLC